jgi:integrase
MAQKSHIKQRITRSVLKTLAPREKAFVAWDSEVKGFGVRVQPGGSLSYVAVHRLTGAKNASWIVLGKVSELTPEIARDRARAAIVAARDGRHVGEEARERGRKTKAASAKPDAILVLTAVQKYLHHLEVEVSERTGRRRSEATLRASKLWLSGLSDTFGRMTLEALTAEHVRQVIASAAPSSKRNVAGAVARLMSWTVECGYLKLNPCANVRRPRAPAARTRTPSVDEVRRIRAACDDLMAEGAWTRVQRDTVLTLLLTGQRRSEVTEMRWEDIELRAGGVDPAGDPQQGAPPARSPAVARAAGPAEGSPCPSRASGKRPGVSGGALGRIDGAVDGGRGRMGPGADENRLSLARRAPRHGDGAGGSRRPDRCRRRRAQPCQERHRERHHGGLSARRAHEAEAAGNGPVERTRHGF